MHRPLLITLAVALFIMSVLTACSDPAPTASPPEDLSPTATPAPTETPATAPTAPQTGPPTPEPSPDEELASLSPQDREAVISSLSEDELACIDQEPEGMITALIGDSWDSPTSSVEERARIIGCLDDETLDQFFVVIIVPGPGPLSAETIDCVLSGDGVIDPRALITAGLVEDEPERAFFAGMAAFNVSIACMTDEEWERVAQASGMADVDRVGSQCLMAELGGPAKYAEALLRTRYGEVPELIQAAAECPVVISVPWQPPVTPTPMPTATAETPTPADTQTQTSDITSTNTLLPDLVIEIEARLKSSPNIERGDRCIMSGRSTLPWHVAEITAPVRNVDGGHSGGFVVHLNNAETEMVDGLEAGADTATMFSTGPRSNHVAVVDAGSFTDESEESNNTAETFMEIPALVPPGPTCTPQSGHGRCRLLCLSFHSSLPQQCDLSVGHQSGTSVPDM